MQRFSEEQEELIHGLIQDYVEENPDCDYKYKALLAKWSVPLCAICKTPLKSKKDIGAQSRGGLLCTLCASEIKINKQSD